jgi:prophage tail gpP-like protein
VTDPDNECRLVIDGKSYGGWTRIEVQRGIEQIAGGFVLQLTARYPGSEEPLQPCMGRACQVFLGNDLVITGYVDDFETDDTDTSSYLRVEGRDKTADLVDCSAVYKSGQWRNVRLEQIVADIARPFGITVAVAPGTSTGDVFKRFALEEGEKAFAAIDRACRLRAVLPTSTPEGNLLLTNASEVNSGVRLIEGVNMLRFNSKHSWKERHSLITLKGQVPGDNQEYGEAAAHLMASAKDEEIDRYRPLVVIAEHGTSNKSLAERAQWEVNVRMGRGKRGGCSLVGWRTGKDGQEGPLWRENTLVHVTSPRMYLDMELLIVACSYQLTEKGKKIDLTFARREAFELVEGVGRSRLNAKLSDKTQKEKKKKGEGIVAPWELTPRNPLDPRGARRDE